MNEQNEKHIITGDSIINNLINDETTVGFVTGRSHYNTDRSNCIIAGILFNFPGFITTAELAKRYYIYMLPHWDDDGNHTLLYANRHVINDRNLIITAMEQEIKDYLDVSGNLDKIERIDATLADDTINCLLA